MSYIIAFCVFLFPFFFSVLNSGETTYYGTHYYFIKLNSDSTFEKSHGYGPAFFYSTGTWKVQGRNLTLHNKYRDVNALPIKVNELNVSDDSLIVYVNHSLDTAFPLQIIIDDKVFPVLNGKAYIDADVELKCLQVQLFVNKDTTKRFTPTPVHKVLSSEVYCLQNQSSNRIYVDFNFDYRIFYYELRPEFSYRIGRNKLFIKGYKRKHTYQRVIDKRLK
jgi:hypothetical protein